VWILFVTLFNDIVSSALVVRRDDDRRRGVMTSLADRRIVLGSL